MKFGEFELSQGRTSEYYVDKYLFETDPNALKLIAEAFVDQLDSDSGQPVDFKLAGVALGAVPLVAIISVETDRQYVIVRKQEKDHGTGNRIEGCLNENEEVIVIEDVTTTVKSAIDAARLLRNAGAVVNRVLVV